MKAEDLKNSILQLAMQGKLVPQDPNDEPASILLEKIHEEKEKLIKDKKIKRNNKESFIFRKNGHFYEKVGKKGESVCIDDEIPFDIPDNWGWCRLGFIGDWGAGSTPKKGESKYYNNGTIPWLKTGDLNNGYINEVPEFITEIALKETSVRLNPIGSVLIAMYGATIGKVGILNIEATTNQACCACLPFNGIYNKFLFYYLMSQNKNFNKMGEGGAQPNISRTKIINYLFPIPPLKEQKRIVEKIEEIIPFVNEYGNYKEDLDKLNSEFSNKLKSSILQEAIQGKLIPQDPNDEPASVLLERIKDEKERLIKEKKIKRNKNESYIFKENNNFYEKIGNNKPICIDDEVPFNIPSNWSWCRLENVVELINGDRGKNYPAKSKLSSESGIPFISAINLKEGKIFEDNLLYMTQKQYDILSRGKLKRDDLIFCLRGSLGKNAIFNLENGAIASSLVILRRYMPNIDLRYLFYYINSNLLNQEIKKYNNGTAQPNLAASNLKKFYFPVPPYKEQKEIVSKIGELLNSLNF